MNRRIVFLSTFMMLGASAANATELADRVSALKQQYISCLGSDYQGREAACRGIYEQLQRQQTQLETQPTIVFDKNQVRQAEAEAQQQERDARNRRQQLERVRTTDSTRDAQKSHSPTTVPTEKNSVTDLMRYEIAQERRACEQVRSWEVCAKIASERYQALQGQSSSSVASHKSSESSSESDSSYRVPRHSVTYRDSSASSLPERTTYEIERSKLATEAPQRGGIREPQELRKAEGIREPQGLREPQPLGQSDEMFLGNTTYETERNKLQYNR